MSAETETVDEVSGGNGIDWEAANSRAPWS
jgi:hypothetical protein